MVANPCSSIVIPTCRPPETVGRALQALARQADGSGAFEVVVVVDGDGREVDAGLAHLDLPYALTVLHAPQRGRAAAVNAGVARSRGDLVILLDDDMEPSSGFVAAHRAAQARSGAEVVAVIGAAPIRWNADSPPVVRYIGAKFNAHLTALAAPDSTIGFRDVYTGNFSIPREVLVSAGGFDSSFTAYGNEDGELALRLQRAGVVFRFSRVACARQYYEKDFPALARDTIAKGRTAVQCALKHPDSLHDLKLATWQHGTRRSRWLRAALLSVGERWGGLTSVLIESVDWLTSRRLAPVGPSFGVCLDYCYWLGARAAVREHAPALGGMFFTQRAAPAEQRA